MRVIITGGTGLLGKNLVAALLKQGHEVIVLSRNPQKASGLPAGAQPVGWDAKSSSGWGKYADGADVIINLAG
ncbi:MAG: NAD-dependent epimerase/dehydratase family protein, partial [Anaerolineales bacterium]|nr:NAD-dependent epimerase/dehydratase family protein [Anaerolineales bacterium]